MSNRDFASKQLNKINNRISEALNAANREPTELTLIAASKQQPSSMIRDFHTAGLSTFGENYLQEGLLKQQQLTDLDIDWHFIGKLQSNKCNAVAEHFNWVHTIDRLKLAERFNKWASTTNNKSTARLNLLVQLNIDQEDSKAGIPIDQAATLCAQINELENVTLRGFMLIPKPTTTLDQRRRPFAKARITLEAINQKYGFKMDSLSMGMSNDLEAAIIEGSTMIRIGTDLFGPRNLT